tara:strand:+ start:24337 stop:24714 length:378 start_codon:yes stop_codon:yes gene_type:complete
MTGITTYNLGVVANHLTVTGGSTSVTGYNSRLGAGNVTTFTSSAFGGTISGGVTPYTILWEYVSGDDAGRTTGSLNSTTFSRTVAVTVGQYIVKTGVFRMKVTDDLGTIAYGPNCTAVTQHAETT